MLVVIKVYIEKAKVSGEGLETVVISKYLGVMIRSDGDMEEEVTHRLSEGRKIC